MDSQNGTDKVTGDSSHEDPWLPDEIILCIAEQYEYPSDILPMALCNRRLYSALVELLYQKDTELEGSLLESSAAQMLRWDRQRRKGNTLGNSSLVFAIRTADTAVARYALKAASKCDPQVLAEGFRCGQDLLPPALRSFGKCSPMSLAATLGNLEIFKLLVEAGCSIKEDSIEPDGWQSYAIRYDAMEDAVRAGQRMIVEYLLDEHDTNSPGMLHVAVAAGHLDLATMFLDRFPGLVNERRNYRTPLHDAVDNGEQRATNRLQAERYNPPVIPILDLLLSRGADIEANSWPGRNNTALQFALRSFIRHEDGSPHLVVYLIERGAEFMTGDRPRSLTPSLLSTYLYGSSHLSSFGNLILGCAWFPRPQKGKGEHGDYLRILKLMVEKSPRVIGDRELREAFDLIAAAAAVDRCRPKETGRDVNLPVAEYLLEQLEATSPGLNKEQWKTLSSLDKVTRPRTTWSDWLIKYL